VTQVRKSRRTTHSRGRGPIQAFDTRRSPRAVKNFVSMTVTRMTLTESFKESARRSESKLSTTKLNKFVAYRPFYRISQRLIGENAFFLKAKFAPDNLVPDGLKPDYLNGPYPDVRTRTNRILNAYAQRIGRKIELIIYGSFQVTRSPSLPVIV